MGTNLLTASGGKIENIGLLRVRAYLTYDGTAVSPSWKVDESSIKTTFRSTTTESTVSTFYSACDYIDLECTSKSLPKFEDAPTWSFTSDDPDEKVGTTRVGKPEKISTLEFGMPTSLIRDSLFLPHQAAGSVWTIVYTYNDAVNEDYVYQIVVPKCQMLGFGGDGGENNSASNSTLKFQARGGDYEPIYVTPFARGSSGGSGGSGGSGDSGGSGTGT